MRTAGNDIARLGRKMRNGSQKEAGTTVWNPRLQTSQSISEHTDIKTAAGLDRSRGIIQKRIAASKKHHEAHTTHPPSLVKKIFGIGPSDGVWPPSRLIFPLSPFAVCWTAITCFFLLYTAVVTPAVIAFHWLDEECAKIPTLEFDCMLDTFFLLDILYQFFVGVIINTDYIDDPVEVAKRYAKGALIFDMATSIPVSYLELQVALACGKSGGSEHGGSGMDTNQLRFIRAMKPLRWFKLARVIKLNKAGAAVDFIVDYFSIAPSYHRLLSLCGGMFGAIHLAACASWLVKVLASSRADVDQFIEGFDTAEYQIDISTSQGKLHLYGISVYWVTTVFSTVGFGDISPANATERALTCILMLTGAVVFGNLLAELAEINRATQMLQLVKLERVQAAVDFMGEHHVPPSLKSQVLRWTRFFHVHSTDNDRTKNFLEQLPMNLQSQLVTMIFGKILKQVPIFDLLKEESPNFLMEVWSCMEYHTFAPGAIIVEFGDPANRIIVIANGELTVYLEHRVEHDLELAEITLKAGDFIGDFALLGDQEWGSSTMIGMRDINVEVRAHPNKFAVCLSLDQPGFDAIVASHSSSLQKTIQRFKELRIQHRLEAQELGVNVNSDQGDAAAEAVDFIRVNRIIIRWMHLYGAFMKERRKDKLRTIELKQLKKLSLKRESSSRDGSSRGASQHPNEQTHVRAPKSPRGLKSKGSKFGSSMKKVTSMLRGGSAIESTNGLRGSGSFEDPMALDATSDSSESSASDPAQAESTNPVVPLAQINEVAGDQDGRGENLDEVKDQHSEMRTLVRESKEEDARLTHVYVESGPREGDVSRAYDSEVLQVIHERENMKRYGEMHPDIAMTVREALEDIFYSSESPTGDPGIGLHRKKSLLHDVHSKQRESVQHHRRTEEGITSIVASHEALDAKIDALARAMSDLTSTLSDAPLASNSGQRPLAEQAFAASGSRGLGPAGSTSGIPLPFAAAATATAACVGGQQADDLREHSPTSEFAYAPGNYGDDEALANQMREAFHQIRSADASLAFWRQRMRVLVAEKSKRRGFEEQPWGTE